MSGWQIVAGAVALYAVCAAPLLLVLDEHHPITHLAELLHRHLGGH
ncbi:hypothetical protein ACFV1U_03595 [Streptomyces microflavus]